MFAMRKGETRTLTGDGTTVEFQPGTFKVSKYAKAVAARFKVRLSLTKATSDAALTAAQRRTFLDSFDITVQYGAQQQHTPFSKVTWNKMRNLVRYGLGSEIEGFTDSSTGLARTISSTATAVTFYLRVPFTALGWQDPSKTQYWGVGHTQAKTMRFELRQNTVTLPSGFAVSGNITIDLLHGDEVPAAFDTWSYIPTYRELSETNRVAERLSKGLTALIIERTAVHASTTMQECKLAIRDYIAYENVTLAEVITRYRDPQAYFPSEADISDEYTLVWAVPPGVQVGQLPTGKPVFEQVTANLATMLLAEWAYVPVSQDALEKDIALMASLNEKRICAVSAYHLLEGGKLPKTHQFCAPILILVDGDKEFDTYAGLLGHPGTDMVIPNVPPTLRDTAKSQAMARRGKGEYAKSEDTVQQVALSVPLAGSPEGLVGGSKYLDKVRAALAES